MSRPFAPVTDAEVSRALSLLRDYPSGLSRADLERHFRSDRRGRQVVEALVATGGAAVINCEDSLGHRVYRLARNAAEVEAEARKLTSYQESLERRREGLLRAWKRGGAYQAQEEMF